jgi:hypothetical protein
MVIQANQDFMDCPLASVQKGCFPPMTILWPQWGINEYHTPWK